MIAQIITSQYDNKLQREDISLRDTLSNPLRCAKDKLPQWMFIESNAPIRRRVHYTTIHALIIEYDKGKRIEEFEAEYKHLQWVLHTTSSHCADKHKFRVILPLDIPYEYDLITHQHSKIAISEYFAGIDESCFSNFQKLPAYTPDYYWNYNIGAKFSLNIIKGRLWELHMEQEMMESIRVTMQYNAKRWGTGGFRAYKDATLANIESELRGVGACKSGHRYNDLVRFTRRLLNATYPNTGEHLFSTYEVEHIILCEYDDAAVRKMVRDLCASR